MKVGDKIKIVADYSGKEQYYKIGWVGIIKVLPQDASDWPRAEFANGRYWNVKPCDFVLLEDEVLPARHGYSWPKEEETSLREEYERGDSIQEIARHHRRKEDAITCRLEKLGYDEFNGVLEKVLKAKATGTKSVERILQEQKEREAKRHAFEFKAFDLADIEMRALALYAKEFMNPAPAGVRPPQGNPKRLLLL